VNGRLPGVEDQSHDASTSLRQFPHVSVHVLRHRHPALLGLGARQCRVAGLALACLLAPLTATRQQRVHHARLPRVPHRLQPLVSAPQHGVDATLHRLLVVQRQLCSQQFIYTITKTVRVSVTEVGVAGWAWLPPVIAEITVWLDGDSHSAATSSSMQFICTLKQSSCRRPVCPVTHNISSETENSFIRQSYPDIVF